MLRKRFNTTAVVLTLALVGGAAAALAAPGTKAAIKADYDMVCNAYEKSGAAKAEKSQQAKLVADYILAHLKTDEVKKFLGTFGSMQPADRGPALKKAAKDAGYTGACPFADMP